MLVGCGPSEDELRRSRLDEVAEATFDRTLAFSLALADTEAGTAGDDAAPAAALAGLSVAGVLEGDRLAAGLTLAGLDLLQLRVTGPDEQFLRVDLAGLAALTPGGVEGLERDLTRVLDEAGLAPAARDAVLAATRGDWVRLDAPPPDGATAGRSVGAALEAVLRSATPVDALGRLDDDGPFDGQLTLDIDPAAAAAAVAEVLAGLVPEALPSLPPQTDASTTLRARVVVDEGVARTITIDLAPLAAGDGSTAATGPSELVLDLRPLPADAPLVRAPEVAATVTVEQLRTALDALAALRGAPADGAASGG